MAKVSAAFDAEGSWSELLYTIFTLLPSLAVYQAAAENQLWTPALEQHIRQLDLEPMLGGSNLFGEAIENYPVYMATAIAALGCQLSFSRVLPFGCTLHHASQEAHGDTTCD